jgi:rhodanese-related sulfurtransferase
MKSGKVGVLKKMLTDEPEHVATLEEGHGFGEEALIDNSIRNATVKAIDKTVVWTLAKSDFDSIMKSSFLEEITPEDILSNTKGQINYIDVRMKMEFDEEHIPEAINIPLDEFRHRYSELDTSKEYYVYCLMGARSATAAFLMNSQGLKAKSIKGGILEWPGAVEEGSEGLHIPFKPT